jgi:solute carrier family 50 protein (sugar transporter)
MMYAVLLKDYYIFISNFPGLVVGMYYSITALVLLSGGKTSSDVLRYNIIEGMIVVGLLYFALISLLVGLYLDETQQSLRESIVASTGVACAVMYYVAPCSTIYQVVATRNASTIHAPMMIANAANSFLWLVYGVSIQDPFVYAPNVIGFGLSALQLLLALLFKGGSKGDVAVSVGSSRYDVVSQRDAESGIESRQY